MARVVLESWGVRRTEDVGDIVFNLVIFFLIVTDLTQKELENLVLHSSSDAVLTTISWPASSVNLMYMGRGTLYLMATILGSSPTRAQSSGLIR